jgi:CMP-N-acetylneuraminic acid synthetase
MARGEGSTLKRKNAYPILGKPMLQWCLEEAKKAKFIDHVFVWTEDDELKQITKDCQCEVIERYRDEVHYHGGFSNPNDWGQARTDQIEEFLWETSNHRNNSIDIQVDINCNYCLMPGSILEDMYRVLMEDMTAEIIYPVSKFHGDLFQPYNGMLFPVWHCQNLPKQQYPPLVLRGSGISITHKLRQEEHVELRSIYHTVKAEYLLDVHDKEDIELAEYYLSKR